MDASISPSTRPQLIIPSFNTRTDLNGVSYSILAKYLANIINAEYNYTFELSIQPKLTGTLLNSFILVSKQVRSVTWLSDDGFSSKIGGFGLVQSWEEGVKNETLSKHGGRHES